MQEDTTILSLPLIQGNQAQKHITHNEALRRLDALVQPVVADIDRPTPPAAPENGARHIVAAGATGDWAGHENAIAVREDNAWAFIAPARGWRFHVEALSRDVVFDGTAWTAAQDETGGSGGSTEPAPGPAEPIETADVFGINATADATNRLTVSAAATLLNHDGGGHQLKINKSAERDTASLLFQSGYSGRAEMGCVGPDGFAVKVSADGAAWNTALRVDPASGAVSFPSGFRQKRADTIRGRWTCYTNNRWVRFSTFSGADTETYTASGGFGAEPDLDWKYVGPFVEKGRELSRLTGTYRGTSNDIGQFDFRMYLQHGPAGEVWASDAQTTRILVHGLNRVEVGDHWSRLEVDLGRFIVPEDGHLLCFMRPSNPLASQSYIDTNLNIETIG